MKVLTDKQLKEIVDNGKAELLTNLKKDIPKKANAIQKIILQQLDRTIRKIDDWRTYVEAAEDVISPDREPLMEYYKDFVDDYQLFAVMQHRTLKAISGSFHIYDDNGEIDKVEDVKFINPKGYPLKWFRDFMSYVMDSVFYGWEAIQLGDIVNDTFSYVEKIPEENQIPLFDSMLKSVNFSYLKNSDNVILFSDAPYDTWVIRVGDKNSLGLINKCAPYIIYKSVFGSWSQHANVFGMPLKKAKTDLTDRERKQNLIDALESLKGNSYIITDLFDELEVIEQKGGGDPHQIYGGLIDKCDSAISKAILSQTGTTDEKAYSGSANVHLTVEEGIVFSDKLFIESIVNEKLIPRMKKIGVIPQDKKIYGGWDYSEDLTIKEWSEVIQMLSKAGYFIPTKEVTRLTGIELDDQITAVPNNKTFSIMNKVRNRYGTHDH